MCGICAILNSNLTVLELRKLGIKLSKEIRHRGPDWSGIHVQSLPNGRNSVLAHERLAIVDPNSGHQPLFDSTGNICVTVNGEIYNHQTLHNNKLDQKETEQLTSHSDCAILPSLVKAYGTDFIPWLDGKFAFLSSDRKTGRIIAARDPIGICPLYIGWGKDGSICFASEFKCLTEHCFGFDIFPPGHFYDSFLGTGRNALVRYYCPSWWSLSSPIPESPVVFEHIRESLEAAVEKRLMSDVPFGVLLSGGLDSSIIAAILAQKFKCMKDKKLQHDGSWFNSLHSFSIGLPGSPDLEAARKVAELLKTDHHEFTFTVEEGIDNIRDVIYYVETYDVTTVRASTPLYLLSRMIRSLGLKFVLSGEGADEIFGGYLYFHKAPNGEELHRETQRKIHNLHYYDVLRANKAPMGFGLEVRVPFLDKSFLDLAMSINPSEKLCKNGRIEKWILRSAFDGCLPNDVLWRQKEQFSDGVGYSWIDGLKHHAEEIITKEEMDNAPNIFKYNTPRTKEAYWYRKLFYELFPHRSAEETVPGGPSIACSTPHVMHWDASFETNADQSGRSVLGIHQAGTQFQDAFKQNLLL